MDALFADINQAWSKSFLTQSKACIQAKNDWLVKHQTEEGMILYNDNNITTNGENTIASSNAYSNLNNNTRKNSPSITVNWKCSYCASKVRLLSISGGVLDNLVRSSFFD